MRSFFSSWWENVPTHLSTPLPIRRWMRGSWEVTGTSFGLPGSMSRDGHTDRRCIVVSLSGVVRSAKERRRRRRQWQLSIHLPRQHTVMSLSTCSLSRPARYWNHTGRSRHPFQFPQRPTDRRPQWPQWQRLDWSPSSRAEIARHVSR